MQYSVYQSSRKVECTFELQAITNIPKIGSLRLGAKCAIKKFKCLSDKMKSKSILMPIESDCVEFVCISKAFVSYEYVSCVCMDWLELNKSNLYIL